MSRILDKLNKMFFGAVSIAPLIVLRIALGALFLYSILRTAEKDWIRELYIDPTYHFGFFSWLTPLDGAGMYWVFIGMGVSALGILLGLFYRVSTTVFFVLFTYVELLDKTYYLNHYYLVSLLSFWLIVVPAHRSHSLDALLFPKIRSSTCAGWHLLVFKIQLSIVYFFAGLAKVNPDWLFRAQPLATWLPGRYELPLLGSWMHYKLTAFLFSWAGCIYDLTIWIFLWIKKTRLYAYVLVLVFHILTAILFPRIGMFPFIMMTGTIIFFSPSWHEKVLSYIPFPSQEFKKRPLGSHQYRSGIALFLSIYFIVQLYLPFRHFHYTGNLFWHEQGYRFSWRVMLMEKNGYTTFILRDPEKNTQKEVELCDHLTAFQQQQLRSQPDMILQFAKHLGDEFVRDRGYPPQVFVKSKLSLNGRRSQDFTNDTVDLYSKIKIRPDDWIIPFSNL